MPAARKRASPTTASVAASNSPYLEWGPIFGGSTIAVAISVVLLQFGKGIGLSVNEPMLESGGVSWNVLVAGLWTVWVALTSAAAGGYVAGRMRQRWVDASEQEVEFRDGVHGLVVWAVATISAAIGIALIAALQAVGVSPSTSNAETLAADALRVQANVSVIFAFATAAGSMLAAAAAWWMATLGGEHRDQGVDVHALVPAVLRRR